MNYSEDDNPLGVKSDFILSLCELIMGSRDGIEAEEKSVIDRCLPLVYQNYFSDPKPENMPILGDLYDCLRKQKEPQAQRIATALEIYVNGSLKESNGLIGENGCNLSGGEIQKLVLCRTFIQNPKCIILDEATSNLDSKSRKIVKEYIQNSYATILIVDHTEEFRDVCDYEITI